MGEGEKSKEGKRKKKKRGDRPLSMRFKSLKGRENDENRREKSMAKIQSVIIDATQ